MQQLTIIIPFLNEGTEIGNTILSIRETCVGHPYILLINDASTDGYNYLSVAQQHGCQYIHHQERKGIAASRNEGGERMHNTLLSIFGWTHEIF